jgi:hypothetical protein
MSGQEGRKQAVVPAIAVSVAPRDETGALAKRRGRRWREHAAALEEFVRNEHPSATTAVIETDDLTGLPPELLKELSIGKDDPLDAQIIAVFQSLGGTADLDQLLIGLYRKFQVIQKRRFLQNKLWRMVRKGEIEKAGSARGRFTLIVKSERRRGKKRRK